ncbi:MAG: hypothetical protein NUV53_03000, partial [Patescibacteria group bacterium]|nr:hypothetical protein [Patescibacteria group bacterium]
MPSTTQPSLQYKIVAALSYLTRSFLAVTETPTKTNSAEAENRFAPKVLRWRIYTKGLLKSL